MIVALFESDDKYMAEGVYFVNTDHLYNMEPEKELKKILVNADQDYSNRVTIPTTLSFVSGAWGKEFRERVLVDPPFHLDKIVYASVED